MVQKAAELLSSLSDDYAPPPFVGGEPVDFGKTRLLLEEADQRSRTLEADRAKWGRIALRRDRSRIARALGSGSGFAEELASLDWPTVRNRLAALRGELRSPRGQSFVDTLEERTRSAETALTLLREEYRSGGWRRKSMVDVRDGRGIATVLGVTEEGLLLEGSNETAPWSKVAGNAEWMHQLFRDRLSRPYTDSERADIGALMHLVAVHELGERARVVLSSDASPLPQAEEMRAPLDAVASWFRADGTPSLSEWNGEAQAVETFLFASQASREGAWSRARALTEELLDSLFDSLFVLLLVDGSLWQEEAPR